MPSRSPRSAGKPGTKYGGGTSGRPLGPVRYSEVPAELLRHAVDAVTSDGDAVTLGRTSEGGAYYVGVLSDGLLEKFYADSPDELATVLERLIEVAESK